MHPCISASVVAVACALLAGLAGLVRGAEALTTAQAVRELDEAAVAEAPGVRIEGVVTYYNAERRGDLVVQDETAGVYVVIETAPPAMRPGDRIAIAGHVRPGGFAPVVAAREIAVLGPGAWPAANEASLLPATGAWQDCRWVEVRGVIRSVTAEYSLKPPRVLADVAADGARVTAYVLSSDLSGREVWVDAAVRMRGVFFHFFTADGQMFDRRFMVPGEEHVLIDVPAPAAPWTQPATPFHRLLGPGGWNRPDHRVRVRGVVTAHRAGRWLTLSEGGRGLLIESRTAAPLEPGQMVDALGFPAPGEYHPVLEDAVVKPTGERGIAEPESVDARGALLADGRLVRIEGRLEEVARTMEATTLVLRAGEAMFTAHLPAEAGPLALDPGSEVAIEGICLVRMGRTLGFWERGARPESFRIELRSPGDVVVWARPPWWTLPRALWTLGGVSALALAGWCWSALLARRVAARARALEEERGARRTAEARLDAVTAERKRLAGELHDALEQGLTGVALQVETIGRKLVRDPEAAARHVELARHLVRQSQAEVRRSVWDLQSQALDARDLCGAFRELARQLGGDATAPISVEIEGAPRPLPKASENHLLRIGQEAVANALKHGKPASVSIHLSFLEKHVVMTVRDDGRGLGGSATEVLREGHFGLRGMRERARRLGGEFHIESAPGRGTAITVRAPVRPAGEGA
jgi:signal transduction histidine kinase